MEMSDKPETPQVTTEPEGSRETAPPVTEQSQEAAVATSGAPEAETATLLSERTSVWSLMLGVLTSPGATLEQVARERRVGQAAVIVTSLSLFVILTTLVVMGNVGAGTAFGSGTLTPLDGVASQVLLNFSLFWAVFFTVLEVIEWFTGAAILTLLGEVMGEQPDGRAMLAAMGFAQMPAIFVPILQGIATLLGSITLTFLFSVGIGIWTIVLDVMAVRSALRTTTGKAALIFFAPLIVCCGLAIFFLVFIMASFMPLLSVG